MTTPLDQLPPSSRRLGSMISDRADLIARIGHVEAENARLEVLLRRGPSARLLGSPTGIVAILLAVILGALAGVWTGNADARGRTVMGNLF
jgi:hypothetical protein